MFEKYDLQSQYIYQGKNLKERKEETFLLEHFHHFYLLVLLISGNARLISNP